MLLGSTAKMGAGTNVQTLLVAVHHLDVGWRPSDMTQRNGRIIRQGNQNKQVYVYNYVTESTFDAYLYQTLENKQKFISQIMTSKSPMGIRSLSAYIRKMALDGYCLNLDLPQLRRMAYLLQNCSSNLNQVAKRANESNKIYSADLDDLRTRLDELISIGRQILSKLAEL